MMKKIFAAILTLVLTQGIASASTSVSQMEYLDRGTVAVKTDSGV